MSDGIDLVILNVAGDGGQWSALRPCHFAFRVRFRGKRSIAASPEIVEKRKVSCPSQESNHNFPVTIPSTVT